MSKVLIDRDLAVRVCHADNSTRQTARRELRTILAAPISTPELPIKAYYHEAPNEYGGFNKSVGLEVRKAFIDAPLVLEADALARVACLEGEIAKRDARIAGLHNDASYYAARNEELRAELAALNAAPVQQVSVPASAFASRAITHYEAALLAAFPSGSSGEVFNQWNEARRVLYTAPAAPAADAYSWRRKEGVNGIKQFMTQKCYDAQTDAIKRHYEPFKCANCKAADAGLGEALDYQALFDAIAAATSVYANGAINISVQAFRDALAAHRDQGVV